MVEVDEDNEKKVVEQLDIEIPVMTSRVCREYKNLTQLDITAFDYAKVTYKQFTPEEYMPKNFAELVASFREFKA